MLFSVPVSRSKNAIHRYATTVDGRIHASSTNASTVRRTAGRARRIIQASVKPRMFWPMMAEPSTNSIVSHSALWNSASFSALV